MQYFSENRKIGIALTALGSFFFILGVVLFFDRPLLSLGNVMFLVGTVLMIGYKKTVALFMGRHKLRGSICFFGGMALVLLGFTFTGLIFEIFGILNLFGNFFPLIAEFLRRLPFIGTILNYPFISRIVDKITGPSYILPMSSRDVHSQ